MIRAKNYETVCKFVKVMPGILCPLFSRTQCINAALLLLLLSLLLLLYQSIAAHAPTVSGPAVKAVTVVLESKYRGAHLLQW